MTTDGNTYYYAHFSQYVRRTRDVHPGRGHRPHRHDGTPARRTCTSRSVSVGPNGGRIDPYPTLKSGGLLSRQSRQSLGL